MEPSQPGSAGAGSADRVAGLVSVVVPVHNRPQLLVEAVESALGQSYPNLEVLIVDDASTDATPQTIAGLAERGAGRVRAIRHGENRGPGASRETGRCAARGEFLQFLDSDDLLLPDKLELQVAALAAAPAASIAYGWTRARHLDGALDERPVRRTGEHFDALFPALLAGRIWITATPLYRAAAIESAGGWSSLRLDEDWELEARLAARGARLAYVESWVAEHRAHAGEHAGSADRRDPSRLRDRAAAMRSVFDSAATAGVGVDRPEMARFARSLFLLARRCGAAGLAGEARSLFALARRASTPDRASGWDFRLIGALAATIGWRVAGRLATCLDVRGARRRGGASPQ